MEGKKIFTPLQTLLLCILLVAHDAAESASTNTPSLGFNTWDITGRNASFPNAAHLKETADLFVSTGLASAGFTFLNLDDCWMTVARDSKGRQVPDPLKFLPSAPGRTDGIALAAAYLSERNLNMGIYTAMGETTYAGHAGSCGAEAMDTAEYVSWNMSYLKIDAYAGAVAILLPTRPRSEAALQALCRSMHRLVCDMSRQCTPNWPRHDAAVVLDAVVGRRGV